MPNSTHFMECKSLPSATGAVGYWIMAHLMQAPAHLCSPDHVLHLLDSNPNRVFSPYSYQHKSALSHSQGGRGGHSVTTNTQRSIKTIFKTHTHVLFKMKQLLIHDFTKKGKQLCDWWGCARTLVQGHPCSSTRTARLRFFFPPVTS